MPNPFYIYKLNIYDLVRFYGISTIVGYLMPNSFHKYKWFYFKQFSSVNKVKWFQVLLCITNNSIKHQSFVYTQLNVKTVLFTTIQFCISTWFVCFFVLYTVKCKNSSI